MTSVRARLRWWITIYWYREVFIWLSRHGWLTPLLTWLYGSAQELAPTVSVTWLPSVMALRDAKPENVYQFCRRGVGIARFEAWREALTKTLRPLANRVEWPPLFARLLLLAIALALAHAESPSEYLLAALPTISFNSGSGSDTAASGSGGTAVSGAGAATTAASAVVDLSADGPDLSGVATDGSAAIWVDSSSGRQYGKISAVDNGAKTVTISPGTFANTEGSKNWGIGGKRATLDHADSRTLFADLAAGWTILLEDNQSISSAIAPTTGGGTAGAVTVASDAFGTRRTITQTANAAIFSWQNSANVSWIFRDLHHANSNATKTSAYGHTYGTTGNAGAQHLFFNCSCSSTNKLQTFAFRSASAVPGLSLVNCDVQGCNSNGINLTTSSGTFFATGGSFSGNGGLGIVLDSFVDLFIVNALVTGNTGDGIGFGSTFTATGLRVIANCTIDGNADGIDISANANNSLGLVLLNNIISNNTVGVRGNATSQALGAVNDYNNYYGNGTDRVNWGTGTHDTTLDPQYTNRAGGDFSIGINLRAKGYPVGASQTMNGVTYSYLDTGAAQRQESSGGGLLTHPGMAGGMRG